MTPQTIPAIPLLARAVLLGLEGRGPKATPWFRPWSADWSGGWSACPPPEPAGEVAVLAALGLTLERRQSGDLPDSQCSDAAGVGGWRWIKRPGWRGGGRHAPWLRGWLCV